VGDQLIDKVHFHIITELFPPSLGGQEIRYFEFGRMLKSKGHAVDIYTIDHRGDLPAEEIIEGMSIHRVLKAPTYRRRSLGMPRNPLIIIAFTLLLGRRLRKLSSQDLVLFNQWPVLPQLLFGRSLTAPTCLDWCELRSGKVWHALQLAMAKSTQQHLCVSSALRDLLIGTYGIDAENIRTMVSGLDLTKYRPSMKNRRALLFLGRLSAHKHPEMAIEAVDLLRKRGKRDLELTIAGTGPLLDSLRSHYQQGRPWLHLPGQVDEQEKHQLLAKSSLHLLPSEREGFPRTVAECMAYGIPTITTDHPDNGTVAVVHEYGCGMVCQPGAHHLAAAIDALLVNERQWDLLSLQCRRGAERLDWLTLYTELRGFLVEDD